MKKFVWVFFLLLGTALLAGSPVWAQENEGTDPALAEISKNVARILETQSRILAKLDEIKAELEIVKVRASLS